MRDPKGKSSKAGGPVHILHILWSLQRGGAEVLLLNSLGAYPQGDFMHTLCCLGGDGPLRAAFEAKGCDVHVMGKQAVGDAWRVISSCARLIRKLKPDVVHIHRHGPDVWGQLAALLAGHRCVVATEHGPYMQDVTGEEGFPWYKTALRRLLCPQVRVTLAISKAVADDLLRHRVVCRRRIRIAHNGVDESQFVPRKGARPSGPVIGAAGRLIPLKGFDALLGAFALVRRNCPDAQLRIAGEGPDRGRLDSLVREKGLSDGVELLGELADMAGFLQSLDVFAMPSRREGFGMAVLEAMSCGLPVVASDAGGLKEIVQDGVNGRLVPAGDEKALADALCAILTDRALAERFGRESRRSVESRFTLQRMARRYEQAYRDAMADAAGHPRRDEIPPSLMHAAGAKERRITLLVDYRGQLNMSTRRLNIGMDLVLLRRCFDDLGYELDVRDFASLDLRSEDFADKAVVYQSSEDRDLLYKGYIEDVLLGLQMQGARLVPDFLKFRAHHNKAFMEILRDVCGVPELQTIRAKTFGAYEELLQHPPKIGEGLVLKQAAGCMSANVVLVKDEAALKRAARRISRSPRMWDDLKEVVKGWVRPWHARVSCHRQKFVAQEFVPGLRNDFKVLAYSDRIYVMARQNRPGDFRASGSGLFEWPATPPEALMELARKVQRALQVPFISLDMGYADGRCHVFEFQFTQFGPIALEGAPFHFESRDGRWIKVMGRSIVEEEYARSVAAFLEAD